MSEETRNKAVKKAMNILLSRMRTEKELRDKLFDSGFEEEDVESAVLYVKGYGYLNDEVYAEQYIASRSRSKGKMALVRELKEKGVSDDIIGDALCELPDDNSEILASLIEKKAGLPHKLDEKENRRVFSFLARRGFSSSDIYRSIKEYELKSDGA